MRRCTNSRSFRWPPLVDVLYLLGLLHPEELIENSLQSTYLRSDKILSELHTFSSCGSFLSRLLHSDLSPCF